MSEFSPSKTVSIMIVDNDDDYIDVYKLVLETNLNHAIDYRLIVCYNYEEALQALNLEKPDIIICELSIPGGKGEDLCELVRKSEDPRYTSIIIASSYDSPQDVVRSFNAGADDFCFEKRMLGLSFPQGSHQHSELKICKRDCFMLMKNLLK